MRLSIGKALNGLIKPKFWNPWKNPSFPGRSVPLVGRGLYIAGAGALFFNHGFHDNAGHWINAGGAVQAG